MAYLRPTNLSPIPPHEKTLLIEEYLACCREQVPSPIDGNDLSALNRKLPRSAVQGLLDQVGELLLSASRAATSNQTELQAFLADNPLPSRMRSHLPDEYRAFCLMLNALKQWVSAESLATDRWLLGGTVRNRMRSATDTCMVTGKIIEKAELHHPVRDGRPPIPLSKKGHQIIESATEGNPDDSLMIKLRPLKRTGNRSWKMLRDGCLSLCEADDVVFTRTANSLASARSFARAAMRETGKDFTELTEWLDENQLGL